MSENNLKNIICPKCGEKCIGIIEENSKSLFKCFNNHDIKEEMNKLRKNLDIFKSEIEKILKTYNEVIESVEKYYEYNYTILNDNPKESKEKSYKSFNKNIIKYTNEIINNRYITLENIINLYNKINSHITIIYKIEPNIEEINLFGKDFVKENKQNCEIIYNNKIYELTDSFKIKDIIPNEKKLLEIKLAGVNNITDMGSLFSQCSALLSIPDINKWNTIKVRNMNKLFFGSFSLKSLPDISNFNTTNVMDISNIFWGCRSLLSLPDISKWDTSNVTNMFVAFTSCNKLLNLPDISKWDTSNVIDMNQLFFGCDSLVFLPDISKWDTSNTKDMSYMFRECYSLLYMPDISKWNIKNVFNISNMFYKCKSLSFIPDISKWNTISLKDMSCLFFGCSSLINLPDISIWNVEHVSNIGYLFYDCISLSFLPDLSKWKLGGSCYWGKLNENNMNAIKIPYNFSY